MSAVRYIFSTSGKYVAFVSGGNLFSPNSEWLGFIVDGNEVYQSDGTFLGYLLDDDRIARRRGERKMRRMRPMRPMRPLRPLRPLKRLRMPRLPVPFEDVFETGPLANADVSAIPTPKLDHIVGAKIFAPDGAYLGRISRDRYDSESIGNSYGEYGSRYSATSIFNTYGEYGGPYGRYSPFNSYSTEPPRVMINDRVIGYLTKNQYIANRIDPEELTAWVSAA